MPKIGKSPSRIVCAANRWQDGTIIIGIRHYCPIMRENIKNFEASHGYELGKNCEQGFIDQHGKFFNREMALRIAQQNNQIFRRCGGDETKLFSENLY